MVGALLEHVRSTIVIQAACGFAVMEMHGDPNAWRMVKAPISSLRPERPVLSGRELVFAALSDSGLIQKITEAWWSPWLNASPG